MERVESKEATHRRFHDAFRDWFWNTAAKVTIWDEFDASEDLATIAVEIADTFAALAIEQAEREATAVEQRRIIKIVERYADCPIGDEEQETQAAFDEGLNYRVGGSDTALAVIDAITGRHPIIHSPLSYIAKIRREARITEREECKLLISEIQAECVERQAEVRATTIAELNSTYGVMGQLTGDVYRLLDELRSDPAIYAVMRWMHERVCLARYEMRGEPFDREMPDRPTLVATPTDERIVDATKREAPAPRPETQIHTCPKCGAKGAAFICSEQGCPVNGGAAYGSATPQEKPR